MATKKRIATFQLTDRNWDQEDDEVEEAGHFSTATESEISKRIIKKAKRRTDGEANDADGKKKPFSGFSGFSGFGTKPVSINSSLLLSSANTKPLPSFSMNTPSSKISFSNPQKEIATENETKPTKDANAGYMEKLKSLNVGVLAWLKEHVDKNPYLDLSPVFQDYKKHLESIKTESKESTDNKTPQTKADTFQSFFKAATTSTPLLSTVKAATIATSSGDQHQQPDKVDEKDEDDERDDAATEPAEMVEEKDAFYTIKTKLFFKSGTSWRELGIGNLYLKNIDGHVQLLVRMETATGKVLLNVLLGKGMPVSRTGKNNVMIVCVPNPHVFMKESDGDNTKPLPYLIRVKGSTEADELCKLLKDKIDQ